MLDSKHEMIKIREIKFEKRRFLQFVSSQILAVNHQSNVNHSSTVIRSSFGPKKSFKNTYWTSYTCKCARCIQSNIQAKRNPFQVNGWERLKNCLTHLLLSQILQQSALSFYSWGWSQQTVYYWPQRCTLQCVFLVEFHCCCTAKRRRSIRGKNI